MAAPVMFVRISTSLIPVGAQTEINAHRDYLEQVLVEIVVHSFRRAVSIRFVPETDWRKPAQVLNIHLKDDFSTQAQADLP